MRNATKRKGKIGLSALAAASFAAWAGAPTAHAVGTQSIFTITPFLAESNVAYSNGNWDVWVFAAERGADGSVGANAGIDGVDITIQSPVNLGIEVQKDSGSGVNIEWDANVDGGTPMATGVNAVQAGGNAPPAFGDIVGGTFIGVGQGPYLADYTNNPQVTQAGSGGAGAGVNGLVFANGNVGTSTTDAYLKAYVPPHLTGHTGSTFSTAFVNTGNTADLGGIDNGSVKTLEIDAAEPADPGQEADGANGPVPFANVVVPHGTVFTIGGTIGPSSPDLAFVFSTVVGGSPPPPPPSVVVLNLLGTQAGSTNVGTATMVGSNGSYPAVTVSGIGAPGNATGNLKITGFNPINDNQIVGLDVALTGVGLTQLISDLNNALAVNNAGAVAELPQGTALSILTAHSDNIEIVFPSASTPNANPEFLNYDLSPDGDTVSSITVLPEPTAVGALVLGGMGLLSRRRKNRKVTL
jgi:hypothetical protein